FELLDAAIARLRPADWARPVPRPETRAPWTVKDALAHVTYWKEHHVRAMRRQRQPPWGEVEARNRTVYELWRERPPEDVVAYDQVEPGRGGVGQAAGVDVPHAGHPAHGRRRVAEHEPQLVVRQAQRAQRDLLEHGPRPRWRSARRPPRPPRR